MAKRKPKDQEVEIVVPVRLVLRYECRASEVPRRLARMDEPSWEPILHTLGGGIVMESVVVERGLIKVDGKRNG
jgi:hypothetical protein